MASDSSKSRFSEEGYSLMGAAFEVHNEIGGGLSEEIYQQSFEIELELRSIPFSARQQMKVFYKQRELKKRFEPDLVVFSRIVVELKAVSALNADHEAQLMNYMRISRNPVGYLINFGPIGQLEYKRFILSEML